MPVQNVQITQAFDQLACLLELDGENPYRVRAYRTAARTVQGLSRSVADMVEEGEDLAQLSGIGKELAAKMAQMVETGTFAQLEEVKRRRPAGLLELVRMPGIGPKRVRLLHEMLGITGPEDLAEAARAQRVRDLPGFGAKTEEAILEALERAKAVPTKRVYLAEADRVAQRLVEYLRGAAGVGQVAAARSYRRGRDTVGDLDMLVTCEETSHVMARFVAYEEVERVVSKGQTRSTVFLRSGLQVDLRVVPEESYGAALHYFTGSKEHNVAVRLLGVRRGLKINEYGVFREGEWVGGRTEEDVYDHVGLPYIPPELREDRGEIEAARKGELPQLVTLEDLRGDLHAHTTESDGRDTLEAMAEAARKRGYEYLAVTEHSPRLPSGLDAERLAMHIRRIDALNERLNGIVLLKGVEVDILEDGSLDLPHDILAELDLVVCSVHCKYDLPRKKQTERLLRAMDNPYFIILGHPLARHIGEREPCDIDMERIVRAAKETGTVLEVNGQPKRMDLDDVHARMARDAGVMLAISTDSHSTADLDDMRFGVSQARRGWVTPADVLNTRSLAGLRKLLRK